MSRRILLMIDDYNENRRVEAVLRKVGFDVVGLVTESSLNEQILAFGPDIVVSSGHGEKLSALSIASKLKDHRTFSGSVILGFPSGVKVTSQDLLKARVDRILDSPFRDDALLQNIAQLLRMDPIPILDKYRKFAGAELLAAQSDKDNQIQIVKGGAEKPLVMEIITGHGKTDNPPKSAREEKYRKIAKQSDIDTNKTTFQKNSVREHWKEVKKSWDVNMLADLKKLKLEFAKALFKKK